MINISNDNVNEILKYWRNLFPIMACEEAGELIQSISKVERTKASDSIITKESRRKELVDEIGDMYITLACITEYYGINEDDIKTRINTKINKKYMQY